MNLFQFLCRPKGSVVILDAERKLGDFSLPPSDYDTSLCKENEARRFLFGIEGRGLRFLDVGGRDGKLTYLLGIHKDLAIDEVFYEENRKHFYEKYEYYGLDIAPESDPRVLGGDICSEKFLDDFPAFREGFDYIYSNNVFEHLRKPWIAAQHIWNLLKRGGVCSIAVPFSQRYHESPGDFFRYTHTGILSLFEDQGPLEVLASGYDIQGRRTNWQGGGKAMDIVPVDHFGAWRESWFSVCILRKK